jgi:2-polyprenyl-3-methyl-5-hydroxy-6-metoxy-1,4-benzoquinol methylase
MSPGSARMTDDLELAEFLERKACISCGGTGLHELSAGHFNEGPLEGFIRNDPWGEHPAPFLHGKPWSFVSCKSCGQAFHRFNLSPEWNERRFSKWMSQEAIQEFEKPYKTLSGQMRTAAAYTAHVLQIEQATRGIRGPDVPRVLDFGCGYGGFLSTCSLFGFEAYGVDRSAAKRNNNRFAKVFEELDDVKSIAPFHAITLFEVLEHLDDPRSLVLQLRELLQIGGLLVLETPNCTGVQNITTRDEYLKIHPLEHINAFTPNTMKAFALRLGFMSIRKPVSFVTSDSLKIAKTAARRALAPLLKPTTQMYFRKV